MTLLLWVKVLTKYAALALSVGIQKKVTFKKQSGCLFSRGLVERGSKFLKK